MKCDDSHPIVTNCIFWSNSASDGNQIALYNNSTIDIKYCDIGDGIADVYIESGCVLIWGAGNIDADPCFADSNNGDCRLMSQVGRWDINTQAWIQDEVTSSCIDAGDPLSPVGDEPHPNGNRINMGIYGGTREASKSASFVADTLTFAESQLADTVATTATAEYPIYTLSYSNWHTTGPSAWTSGFFPGSLWLMYESNNDPNYRIWAQNWTAGLEGQASTNPTQDLVFMIYNTFGTGYRLTGNTAYRNVVLQAAQTVAQERYNPNIGGIVAGWGSWEYSVNIDSMMAVELLLWAAKNGGQSQWYDMAVSHASKTMENHVRQNNGSTYHYVNYDPATGAVISKATWQGYSTESTWARGQAWALYGFTIIYRETVDPNFLATAEKVADYFVDNLPADSVPYWDFNAPGIPNTERDTSAAAIAASGLLELSTLADDYDRRRKYYNTARDILLSLCTSSDTGYLSRDSNGNLLSPGILIEGCYHHPDAASGSSIYNESLIFGDYYLIEALLRYQTITPP
jgi:unsaturated chondroitin disaccharide hydrolase